MPDAYVGKNIYIRDTIEGFNEGSNNWYTTVALPIQVTDQIHIRWSKYTPGKATSAYLHN